MKVYTVNTTLFIYLSCSMTSLVFELFELFQNVQESIYTEIIAITWVLFVYIIHFQTIIISAILSDLIKDNLKKMKIVVVEKRINCNNERERAEIQMLYQLMQTRPYEYKVAGIFPLELRSLFSFFSYLITTIIAILQIKRLVF